MNEPGKEGTMAAWMIVNDGQWIPGKQAKFPPMNNGPMTVEMRQTAKDRFQLVVSGLFNQSFKFSSPLPEIKDLPDRLSGRGFHVIVQWSFPKVEAFLNAEPIGVRKALLH